MRAIRKNGVCRVGTLAWVAASLCVCLQSQSLATYAQESADEFVRESTRNQTRIVEAVRKAGSEVAGAHFDAVRALVAAAAKCEGESAPQSSQRSRKGNRKSKTRASKTRKKKARKKQASKGSAAIDWRLPQTVAYGFGSAAVEPLPGKSSARAIAERRVPIELMLLGMLPDSDRALAEIQRRLDSDRSADAFAMFLDSWKNGGETFYEALDRTAGTSEGVFFYDAMLGDFVDEIAGKEQKKQLRKSHDAAHDALHRAFLSYRQYRAFREAVALSLLLPVDVPLPQHLSRYEAKLGGAYSLRDQVVMVLAVSDYDPMVVADLVRESAMPLPVPLWSSHYEPIAAWSEVFKAAMPRMIAAAGHTDAFLKMALAVRSQQVAQVREMACRSIGAAPFGAGY